MIVSYIWKTVMYLIITSYKIIVTFLKEQKDDLYFFIHRFNLTEKKTKQKTNE